MKKSFNGYANKGGVYKITNLKNGKIYIGSAKRFRERASGHLASLRNQKHKNKHLQASFNKHGEDAFLFEVLEVVESDKGERFRIEQKYIDKLIQEGKWEQTFNFKKKVEQKERSYFSKTPDETRKKLSRSSKERWKDPKYRNQISKARKENWQDPKYRKLQSKKRKKAWENKERQNNHKKQMEDFWSQEENKELYAKKIKSYWSDDQWRQEVIARRRGNKKIIEQFRKNCHSKETIKKIAKANTKNHGKLISSEGKVVEVVGLRNFCEQQGWDPKSAMANISKLLKEKGRIRSYKGWKKFIEN